MQHVLVVEDDADVAAPLASFFRGRGFDAAVVASGQEALDRVAATTTDLLVLDLILPDLDGVEVCGILRARGFQGGIVMLSARNQEIDIVTGLDAGADDFLGKPFSVAELESRIAAVLRRITRSYVAPDVVVPIGRAALEVSDHRITYAGVEILTTGREYDVLALLIARRGEVVTSEDLTDQIWGADWSGTPVVLSSAVGRLRKRLEAAGVPEDVVAVRGVGFRLTHRGGS